MTTTSPAGCPRECAQCHTQTGVSHRCVTCGEDYCRADAEQHFNKRCPTKHKCAEYTINPWLCWCLATHGDWVADYAGVCCGRVCCALCLNTVHHGHARQDVPLVSAVCGLERVTSALLISHLLSERQALIGKVRELTLALERCESALAGGSNRPDAPSLVSSLSSHSLDSGRHSDCDDRHGGEPSLVVTADQGHLLVAPSHPNQHMESARRAEETSGTTKTYTDQPSAPCLPDRRGKQRVTQTGALRDTVERYRDEHKTIEELCSLAAAYYNTANPGSTANVLRLTFEQVWRRLYGVIKAVS